jgi:hypothetical protein
MPHSTRENASQNKKKWPELRYDGIIMGKKHFITECVFAGTTAFFMMIPHYEKNRGVVK